MYEPQAMPAAGSAGPAGKQPEPLVPPAAGRVARHTQAAVQERIRQQTIENIASYLDASAAQLDARLAELDREWDIERILELNASLLAFSGVLLGKFVNRKWLYLSLGVTAFLAQHAVQGWCPPLPVLRRLGVRTRQEIEQERNALKARRGDFYELPPGGEPLQQAAALLRIMES